ncbi:MAG: rod shape-determining protein MreC [Candidatus Taylorbacteria bacterium]
MNYPLKNKVGNRRKKASLLGIPILFLILIFLLSAYLPNGGGTILLAIGRPFFVAKNSIVEGGGNFLEYFRSKGALIEENKNLKAEADDLAYGLIRLNILEKENQELKAEFGRAKPEKSVLAYVLTSPGFSPYDTFLLDAGSKDGVAFGDTVSIAGGLGVGHIKEVFSRTSLALLYSSPGEEVTVRIPPQQIMAKAYGRGGGNFEIKLPKDIDVQKGALISMPGVDNAILGVVEAIETDATQSLQLVLVRNLFNINQIDKVYIKKQKQI